jgi:hypothetical protein
MFKDLEFKFAQKAKPKSCSYRLCDIKTYSSDGVCVICKLSIRELLVQARGKTCACSKSEFKEAVK